MESNLSAGQSSGSFLWRDNNKGDKFAILYNHHDNTIIPSLRGEAFREGIEDWKYVLMLDDAIAGAKQKAVGAEEVAAAEAYRLSPDFPSDVSARMQPTSRSASVFR